MQDAAAEADAQEAPVPPAGVPLALPEEVLAVGEVSGIPLHNGSRTITTTIPMGHPSITAEEDRLLWY